MSRKKRPEVRRLRRGERADARTLLGELRSALWQWRFARFTSVRRSLAMRVRWRLRWLDGTPEHAEALQAVENALSARRKCGECGRIVRRHTRLGAKLPRGFPGR